MSKSSALFPGWSRPSLQKAATEPKLNKELLGKKQKVQGTLRLVLGGWGSVGKQCRKLMRRKRIEEKKK